VELFDAARAGIPGRWEGLATTPWITPYRVELTFRADGTYSGRCAEFSNDCCRAFYYGTDEESPLKTYSVEDATLSGNVIGVVAIVFDHFGELRVSNQAGDLSRIELDATGSRLRFEFRRDGHGPILYDLQRLADAE
jgi:hypothetical protein